MNRMLVSLFSFMFFSSQAQLKVEINFSQPLNNGAADTIYYNPSKRLSWNDFKGYPENNHIALAVTTSGFGYSAVIRTINGKGILSIDIFCYFDKNKSWVKQDKESDYALKHEQQHFDISYIATNNFVSKLKAAKFSIKNYSQLLDEIYASGMDELDKLQNEYDGQTRNGQLKNEQLRWNNKIDRLLSSLPKH